MLSLLLKSGEYLTIGEDIVVQVVEKSSGAFQVSIRAPREIPIVRGELLERAGQRPEGFYQHKSTSRTKRGRSEKRPEKPTAECESKENTEWCKRQ